MTGRAHTSPALLMSLLEEQPTSIDRSRIRLIPAFNPRLPLPGEADPFSAEALADLTESIRQLGVLQPILNRIHLETLGSPGFYREQAAKHGMTELGYENHHEQLPTHYGRVLKELKRQESELDKVVSREYIDNMKKGLGHWVEGGNNGYLAWGIFHFRNG